MAEDRLDSVLGFAAMSDARMGKKSTHVIKRLDTGKIIFRGTKSSCEWVKRGFDIDLRNGHPDNVGETCIELIIEEE